MSSSSPASPPANSSHSGKNEPEQAPRAPHDITLSRLANGNAGKKTKKNVSLSMFLLKKGVIFCQPRFNIKKGGLDQTANVDFSSARFLFILVKIHPEICSVDLFIIVNLSHCLLT